MRAREEEGRRDVNGRGGRRENGELHFCREIRTIQTDELWLSSSRLVTPPRHRHRRTPSLLVTRLPIPSQGPVTPPPVDADGWSLPNKCN